MSKTYKTLNYIHPQRPQVLSFKKLPVMIYQGPGSNIMQTAQVYSTIMVIKDDGQQQLKKLIKTELLTAANNLGGLFVITTDNKQYKYLKLYTAIKKISLLKDELTCEVVFVGSWNKHDGTIHFDVKPDFDVSCRTLKITSLEFKRHLKDIEDNDRLLYNIIKMDVFGSKAISSEAQKHINSLKRLRVKDCAFEMDILHAVESSLTGIINSYNIIDTIIDYTVFSVNHNDGWNKQFRFPKKMTHLYNIPLSKLGQHDCLVVNTNPPYKDLEMITTYFDTGLLTINTFGHILWSLEDTLFWKLPKLSQIIFNNIGDEKETIIVNRSPGDRWESKILEKLQKNLSIFLQEK